MFLKAILVDRNNTEAFISLDNGTIISIPVSQVSNLSLGDNIHFSKSNTYLVTNPCSEGKINNNLIDFF